LGADTCAKSLSSKVIGFKACPFFVENCEA
jgi:hypothetical protein